MSARRRVSRQPIAGKPTKGDMDRFINACIGQGYTVRHHTHPKTREKWSLKR